LAAINTIFYLAYYIQMGTAIKSNSLSYNPMYGQYASHSINKTHTRAQQNETWSRRLTDHCD